MNKSVILSVVFMLSAAFFCAEVQADPGLIRLDSLMDQYEAVLFDHTKHISMADNCGICHHEHGSNNMICMDCHSIDKSTFQHSVASSFMACRNCHDAFDRDNPGMPGLKAAYHQVCFDCHRGMSNVGIEPKGCAEICHAHKE